MKLQGKWLAVPGLIALAATAAMLSAYAGASSSERNSPVQPVAFPHPQHAAGALKMNCVYCHFSANKSPDPGMPAVATCMGMPCSYRDRQAGGKKTRRILECETASPVGPDPQAARVRALPAHASRQRRGVVPDMSRRRAEHETGFAGTVAQHGLVHQLSRRTIEPSPQGALRLCDLPLLSRRCALISMST